MKYSTHIIIPPPPMVVKSISFCICYLAALSSSIPSPEDVSVYEGDTARFECRATGKPPPRIR